MFLYMVAELSSLQQVINALTNLNGLPVVIVEVVITTIYTCTPDVYPPYESVLIHSSSWRVSHLLPDRQYPRGNDWDPNHHLHHCSRHISRN